MKKLFRSLVAILIAGNLAWYFFPWGFAYPVGTEAALGWLGMGSPLSDQTLITMSALLFWAAIIAYVGLFLLFRWAPMFFIAVVMLGFMIKPFYGLSVHSAPESTLSAALTLLDGIAIGLAYGSQALRAEFCFR